MAGAAATAVFAIGSHVMSAEGGYDIPAGVNPMVQAHAREMILPEKVADTVRNNMEGGGGSGAGVTFNIHTYDSAGVANFFRENGDKIAATVKQHARDSNGGSYQW